MKTGYGLAVLLAMALVAPSTVLAQQTRSPSRLPADAWDIISAAKGVQLNGAQGSRPDLQLVCDAHDPYCAKLYLELREDFPQVVVRWVPVAYLKPDSASIAAQMIASRDPIAALDRNYRTYDSSERRGGYRSADGQVRTLDQTNGVLKQHWVKWGGFTPMILALDGHGQTYRAHDPKPSSIQQLLDATGGSTGRAGVGGGPGARAAVPAGFKIEAVPVSDVALGDFPYFTLPTGYHSPNKPVPVREFDRVAVWTGDRLEWIEGRIFESIVRAERGKGWSKVEVTRNIHHQVQQAGGVQVTSESKAPKDVIQAWNDGQGYSPGRGDIYNQGASTWLVRRSDRNIWVHFVGNNAGGSWMVIESAPFVATASLLPASELKQHLDVGGRVAIEVNFAVDKADILPDSQPQIDQVLALLRGDPSLRLSIDGHTDATGDAAHNQRLSEARAQSVVAALVAQGIEASRLEAQGHGQSQPVADNDTDEGRAKNRRVELVRLG